MAISILDLYKALPRTNCGACGQPTCMAFAARVIAESEALGQCPQLPPAARALGSQIKEQRPETGRRPDTLAVALNFMQEKVAALDFASLAGGLGADYGEELGRPYLRLLYFGRPVQVFKDELVFPPGAAENPWTAIVIYNYIASQGNQPLAGQWITLQTLPNSVSKAKTLDSLEKKLAAHFSGRPALLTEAILAATGKLVAGEGNADVKALFWPLPRIPILLLFWEALEEENFSAQCHFLFDAPVIAYLDLESLLFLVEQLLDRLMPGK